MKPLCSGRGILSGGLLTRSIPRESTVQCTNFEMWHLVLCIRALVVSLLMGILYHPTSCEKELVGNKQHYLVMQFFIHKRSLALFFIHRNPFSKTQRLLGRDSISPDQTPPGLAARTVTPCL